MDLAKINYDAWRAALPFGSDLDEFEDLSADVQHAWCRAANAVVSERMVRAMREH